MKVYYYCQHVLGVGHIHRSLEVCRTLAPRHQVTMIVGGPEFPFQGSSIQLFTLPGLKMDEQFSTLIPCSNLPLQTIKEQRRAKLLSFVKENPPDCMVIELYPFGRKSFRFELDPLLQLLAEQQCPVFCSLRDILVEKTEGREKFEQRAVNTLNRYFTGLLVHADPALVKLEETFGKIDELMTTIHYTGFISPRPTPDARAALRGMLKLNDDTPLVVASIGSGSVGFELLEATIRGVEKLIGNGYEVMLQCFTGPYLNVAQFNTLNSLRGSAIRVERFSERFVDWLAAADVSVSMAGYNTSMNVLTAGVPSLMYPFELNQEQRMRVKRLSVNHEITLLEATDLNPMRLAELIHRQANRARFTSALNLEGASTTAAILERVTRT